jgi:hypothetical protein
VLDPAPDRFLIERAPASPKPSPHIARSYRGNLTGMINVRPEGLSCVAPATPVRGLMGSLLGCLGQTPLQAGGGDARDATDSSSLTELVDFAIIMLASARRLGEPALRHEQSKLQLLAQATNLILASATSCTGPRSALLQGLYVA